MSILEELVASVISVEENFAECMFLKMKVSVCVVFYSHSEDFFYFYCCTVHFDNVKIPFYQQMHLLLNI
jgi:hypothetical protein